MGESRTRTRGPLYELSPRKTSEDFTPIRGQALSVSPYNPQYDEVFLMSTRTPDASPFRHHRNHYRYVDPTGQTFSPESDVGYGTSFGSQHEFGGHVDIDNISNLLVRGNYDCS